VVARSVATEPGQRDVDASTQEIVVTVKDLHGHGNTRTAACANGKELERAPTRSSSTELPFRNAGLLRREKLVGRRFIVLRAKRGHNGRGDQRERAHAPAFETHHEGAFSGASVHPAMVVEPGAIPQREIRAAELCGDLHPEGAASDVRSGGGHRQTALADEQLRSRIGGTAGGRGGERGQRSAAEEGTNAKPAKQRRVHERDNASWVWERRWARLMDVNLRAARPLPRRFTSEPLAGRARRGGPRVNRSLDK
jgi:hypothetical protein